MQKFITRGSFLRLQVLSLILSNPHSKLLKMSTVRDGISAWNWQREQTYLESWNFYLWEIINCITNRRYNCVCFRRCYKWCIIPKPRGSWPCKGPFCHFCCYDCGWRDFKCHRSKLWRWNKKQCRTPKPRAHRQYDRSASVWNQYRDFDGSLYPDNDRKYLLETVL